MENGGRAGLQQAACREGGGGGGGGCWMLVEARLRGGAPWGFTVQGGLEHNEPLIISKVEQGGKADSLEQPLQVGDEIVIINEVELTGYRQEAVALVKGSYRSLQLTVRRELDPRYVEEFDTSCPPVPALNPPSPPLPVQQQKPASSHHSRPLTGGVQLRIKNRRSEHASRPHSWHSAKLGESQQEVDPGAMDTMGNAWHHSYHPSASTTDLSGGFDSGIYLRKSPDQYSSRGSMESLEPPVSSQHHSETQHHHNQSGSHRTYSSCHQLSSARSSNSIDHLHSKRDSAYSSVSTSSSIPEYLASPSSFSQERSYSLEAVSQRDGSRELHQADMRYVRTVYDTQQGLSQEHELSSTSAALLRSSDSRGRGGAPLGLNQNLQEGRVSHHSSGSGGSSGDMSASNRHSVGPIWGPAASCSSYESLKGAPSPPRRSDSYAALRNHDRPNSWSSLEHARSLRSLQKGSWHHSSGPVASGAAKGSYSTEGQLHTVIEKSPESSPTTKPRQGGGFPQPHSPTGHPTVPPGPTAESGRVILPTGKYPVPQPEPQYAQIPSNNPSLFSSGVYPALAQESSRQQNQDPQGIRGREDRATDGQRDGRMSATENGFQNSSSSFTSSAFASPQLRTQAQEPFRSVDQNSVHSEPLVCSVPTQGQGQSTHVAVHPQAPPSSYSQPQSSRHFSDSAALQHQQWEQREQDQEREHALTRLENALAEVQWCASPDSVVSAPSHDNSSVTNGSQGPCRSLSVLEKVSRFERRDRVVKQRSHSTANAHNNPAQQRVTEKGRSIACGADDLRNMLERSTNGTKVHRTMSYRGGSSEQMKYRTPADPSLALQRSRSSFHLKESRESDSGKDFPWRRDLQGMLGSLQDTSFNRSYRDSLKDAQTKVLRSTSFRRRDLSSSISPPPPAAPPFLSSSSNHQPPSIPAKPQSQEKKGPKTMPKPHGFFITPQLPPPIASPHTPKERHVVSPDVRGPSPPALPSVPPVGPAPMTRICGRRRLGADQKKRSYSEPENMNEVGVSDVETTALFKRGGETSVADRRKMFELAASRATNGVLHNRADLRQLQHDALAEYVERKRGMKRDEDPQRSGSRPQSAYLPDNSNHRVSHCHSDTISVSSSSSLHSLQETGSNRSSSALPPGADLRSFQSNLFYPGRVTTPRPPVHSQPSTSTGPSPELQAQILQDDPEVQFRQIQSLNRDLDHQQLPSEPQQTPGLSKQLDGALQRAQSFHGSRKSASAEDLLERSEEAPMIPQHHRSLSSPAEDSQKQDAPPADARMFGVFISTPGRHSLAEDRLAEIEASGVLVNLQHSQQTIQPGRPLQDTGSSNTSTPRRERQRRTSERQRANSTSTLAASVGLPCPFSPCGTRDEGRTDWHVSERLSQANLDAIIFPGVQQTGAGDGANSAGYSEPLVTDRQSDASVCEDTEKDLCGEKTKGGHSAENTKRISPVPATLTSHSESPSLSYRKASGSTAPSPPAVSHPTTHLSSLRISESSLFGSTDQQQPIERGLSQEDCDEVFLENSPPPSSPPPSKETSSMEDFPPPPSPLNLGQESENQTVEGPSFLPSMKTQPSNVTCVPTSTPTEDIPDLEFQPLLKREKTSEELHMEVLVRQLVLQDKSLVPVLDMFGGKSTEDLMEEIFTNRRLVGKSPWQRRSNSRMDDRIQDGLREPDLNEDVKDLNTKKLELCEALRRSVAALRQEKDALRDDQQLHQALGANIEKLVQERLKANERDKYSMSIGDLEKIVNLLLSLCSRLMRIDRSLLALEGEEVTQEHAAEERDSLLHKRSMVLRQTDDAQELKENLDRRQRVVHAILSSYLTDSQLQDYCRFVSAKPSLLIRQRHLDNLIRQREEQLTRLAESLPQDLAEVHGWSRVLFSSTSPTPSSSPFPPSGIPGSTHSVRPTAVTSL